MATLNPIPNDIFNLWHGAGDFFQAQWNNFLDVVGIYIRLHTFCSIPKKRFYFIGEDDERLWIHGTAIISTLTYWIVGGLFIYMDFTLKPQILRKYKVQVGTNEPLDWPTFKNVRILKSRKTSTSTRNSFLVVGTQGDPFQSADNWRCSALHFLQINESSWSKTFEGAANVLLNSHQFNYLCPS